MHTVEIAGKPIAIINSPKDEGEAWFNDESFKSDLLVLQTADREPLWDGETELLVRRSFAEDVSIFEKGFAKTLVHGDADREDEEGYLVFLVPVRQLS